MFSNEYPYQFYIVIFLLNPLYCLYTVRDCLFFLLNLSVIQISCGTRQRQISASVENEFSSSALEITSVSGLDEDNYYIYGFIGEETRPPNRPKLTHLV